MTRIGLLSDTHGFLDDAVFEHFSNCDEIWHGGDFGAGVAHGLTSRLTMPQHDLTSRLTMTQHDLTSRLTMTQHDQTGRQATPQHGQTRRQTVLRGVYGNIDGNEIRSIYPEQLVFMCEEVKVMMRHIGGYPPRYNPETKKEILLHQPQLFISGHSHILKIMYDDQLQCLHMNPGAAGKQGWHKVRTLIRFVIDGAAMRDCEVIELGKK